MRHILFAVALCISACAGFAQTNTINNHLTLSTYRLLNTLAADEKIPVLIQGDVQKITNFIAGQNEKIKYTAGDIIAAEITKQCIALLNAEYYVQRIDCPMGKLVPLNDVMVKNNNVDSAYYGYAPLTQGYDGSGVVIGIIDEPLDLDHGDFKDDLGNIKIKSLWDQNAFGTPHPDGYSYGKECDSAKLADGNCTYTDNNYNYYSHGSGVAGVAASSGNAANAYRGVAPNADLIVVNLDFQHNFLGKTVDAIEYIFNKADEMHKPCVINTSFGTYAGSHDGKDLTTQAIDNLISEHSGRSLVAACGNAGTIAFHLGYTVTATEQFTWFNKLSYLNQVYFELYADSADFNNVNFSFAADDPAGFIPVASLPADINMLTNFDLSDGDIDSLEFNLLPAGTGKIYVQLLDGVYVMQCVIVPSLTTYYWRFTTSGTGSFDIWSGETTTGTSNYVTAGLPDAATLPEIINYRLPNTDQSIVSSWQCSDKVISVGSYVNRDTMTNYYGDIPPLIDTVGALINSSSHGPTRDNRIKPDICASGARILSTESQVLTDFLIGEDAANYMSPDGMHYLYNGTSFASPIVAGIVALYFQKYPFADYADVKDAILSQAKQDPFTGTSLPNNLWGYGKADAFRTLITPLAAVNNTSVQQNIFVYPNPSAGTITIDGITDNAQLAIYALNGEKLSSRSITSAEKTNIDVDLPAGMYQLLIYTTDNIYTQKIIISR